LVAVVAGDDAVSDGDVGGVNGEGRAKHDCDVPVGCIV
jgi:hypothetical protein